MSAAQRRLDRLVADLRACERCPKMQRPAVSGGAVLSRVIALGRDRTGGDRVPDASEVTMCRDWLEAEMKILEPELVIPVGKLAISQFIEFDKLTEVIGGQFRVDFRGHHFDLIPLLHPSGASPWHRMEPGRTLLDRALEEDRKAPRVAAKVSD